MKIDVTIYCFFLSSFLLLVCAIGLSSGGLSVQDDLYSGEGGGAALGVAHVGVIKVLEEENIPVDMVIGSSMGALVGAMLAAGHNAKKCEDIAREFEKWLMMVKLFDPPFFPISGLIRGKAIRRWLKKHLGNGTFYGVKIPFKVVAYDLIRRDEIVAGRGTQ